MTLVCRHDYRPKNVVRGENLLGEVEYAIAFWCVRCNKRRLDKGWRNRDTATNHLVWLQSGGRL